MGYAGAPKIPWDFFFESALNGYGRRPCGVGRPVLLNQRLYRIRDLLEGSR
jgi:hypothetical protein